MSLTGNTTITKITLEIENSNIIFETYFSNKLWHVLVMRDGMPLYPEITHETPIYEARDTRDKKIIKLLVHHGINKEVAELLLFTAANVAGKRREEFEDLKTNTQDEEAEEEAVKSPEEIYGPVVFKRATDLLFWGQAQDFIISKHRESCAGSDDKYSYALSCVFASTHITSSTGGFHLKLGGDSGSGKSTLFKNFCILTPRDTWMFTSMSGKNMFYDDDIHEGMVVAIDEFENADIVFIRTIKLSTSNFQEGTTHKTVINFKSEDKPIAKRIAYVLLSVLPLDNTEMNSRFVQLDVSNDLTYKIEINKKQKDKEKHIRPKDNKPDFDTQVCRCIYSILNQVVYEIRIPFADVIDWSDVDHTRNWNIFSDIIRSVAFYNILNREFFHKADDPLDGYFLATYEDYIKAVEIYSKIAENNESKLSNNEIGIIKILIAAREQV